MHKIEQFTDQYIWDYSQRIKDQMEKIETEVDRIHVESIKELVEMAYKEGLRDGMRFMDWLANTTN